MSRARDENKRAMEFAGRSLSKRMMTESDMRKKLADKGFDSDVSEHVIERMKYLKFIDDEKFAKVYAQSYANRGYGSYRCKNMLILKGIPAQLAHEVCQGINTALVLDKPMKIIKKYVGNDVSDKKQLQKAKASLFRRGFNSDEISQIIHIYKKMLEEEDVD